MSIWRPTTVGEYFYEGDPCVICKVQTLRVYVGGSLVGKSMRWCKGVFSLRSPDWQQGPPTQAQIDAWAWWALMGPLDKGWGLCVQWCEVSPDDEYCEWSAPVQPLDGTWRRGPLWVSLSVATPQPA